MFLKHTKWAMLWALLILILCGIPGKDIPHISFLELLSFDKLVHAGIFFVLVLLSIRGFLLQSTITFLQANARVLAVVFCIVYGGLLEIMQGTLFQERSADVFDFIANSIGVLLGLGLYRITENKILKHLIK
jgi:VanZ family protein